MKKLIVLLTIAGLLLAPGFALAEIVNVFGDGDLKQIYVTDDNGCLRTYTSNKVGENTTIIWDNQTGMATMVHDYSSSPAPVQERGSSISDPLDDMGLPDLLAD